MHRQIDEVEFTIFDTETTGLEPTLGDRIIEIAAVKIKAGQRGETFESLVNPHREVSPAAFQVNEISQEMLEPAPDISLVMPKFLNFVQDSCLCSYNAGFDLGFLENELKIIGQDKPAKLMVVDVLKMAKRLMPGLERYALWFVAEKLGIKVKQEHRALSDVEMTISVYQKFREILKEKGIHDFKNFIGLFGITEHYIESLNNAKLAQIQEAIGLGVKLKIKYISGSTAQVTEREVIPKQIKKDKSNYYLIGFCCLKNEERYFRIDGILHLEML